MDWKKNRLPIAGVVLVGVAALAVWRIRAKEAETNVSTTEASTPSLGSAPKSEVDELEVRKPGQEPVRFAKRDGVWRMVAPVDAEPDNQAVESALEKLDELHVQRAVSTNPANHARLEVDDEHGVRVIAKKAGQVLLDILIGAVGSGSTMVRRPNEPTVIAVEGSIKYAFNKAVKDWRNKKILDHDAATVREIEFRTADATWKFIRNSTNEWTPLEGQAAIERFEASRVQGIVSSLARMRASDFGAADVTPETAGLATPTSTVTLLVQPPAPETPPPPAESAGGDAGAAPEAAPPPPPETVVLELGGTVAGEDDQHYVRRQGNPTIFVVSRYLGEKLKPTTASFQQPERPDGGTPPPGSTPTPMPMGDMPMGPGGPGGPGGMMGGPGGGGGKVPPDIMRQIQEQLRRQEMMKKAGAAH